MSKSLYVIILIFCIANNAVSDTLSERAWSYTAEDLYKQAVFYQLLYNGKSLDSTDQYMMAAEFKGYIAATIDQLNISTPLKEDNSLNECAKKYTLDTIVYRAAVVIIDKTLDRSSEAFISALTGVNFACDESFWKKKDDEKKP